MHPMRGGISMMKKIFYSHGIFSLPPLKGPKLTGKWLETRGSNSSGNLQKQQRDRL
jgi:hypothetical protein